MHILKNPIGWFFSYFFTSHTLVAIPLKKPSTSPSCSTKFHFQKCIKSIIIQNPMIPAHVQESIGNQPTKLWVRGTQKTRSKTCSPVKICSFSRYSLTLPTSNGIRFANTFVQPFCCKSSVMPALLSAYYPHLLTDRTVSSVSFQPRVALIQCSSKVQSFFL